MLIKRSVSFLAHRKSTEQGGQTLIKITETLRNEMILSCQRQVDHMRIQEKVLSNTEQHLRVSEVSSRNLSQHLQDVPIEHAKTRATIATSEKLILDAIQDGFSRSKMGMSAYTTSGREIFSIGASQETLVELLVLMGTQIRSGDILEIAELLDVEWLQDEFKTLVTSALRQNLHLDNVSNLFSPDRWIHSTRAFLKDINMQSLREGLLYNQASTNTGKM